MFKDGISIFEIDLVKTVSQSHCHRDNMSYIFIWFLKRFDDFPLRRRTVVIVFRNGDGCYINIAFLFRFIVKMLKNGIHSFNQEKTVFYLFKINNFLIFILSLNIRIDFVLSIIGSPNFDNWIPLKHNPLSK